MPLGHHDGEKAAAVACQHWARGSTGHWPESDAFDLHPTSQTGNVDICRLAVRQNCNPQQRSVAAALCFCQLLHRLLPKSNAAVTNQHHDPIPQGDKYHSSIQAACP